MACDKKCFYKANSALRFNFTIHPMQNDINFSPKPYRLNAVIAWIGLLQHPSLCMKKVRVGVIILRVLQR